ncbi:hypothetical protein [Streptomyces broussonetiae]|uniref:TPM domain-containing protein n=1 Tax=Streptomyces broussonetiae TaxID=2686304 RepID=A0ABV5E673_9ACTN
MTPSVIRGPTRRGKGQIAARIAQGVLGGGIAVLWLCLVLPRVAPRAGEPAAGAAAQDEGGTWTADLVLPLVAAVSVIALAAYGYVRRNRRAATRTTPGGTGAVGSVGAPLTEPDTQACAALVEADDCLRASRVELGFARARFDASGLAPYERAVGAAGTELRAAFAIRQRYDGGVPEDQAARRQALAGIVGRCAEAGRRLDAEAPGLERLREADGGTSEALEVAEGRFRELAGRTTGLEAVLGDMRERYAPPASASVTGCPEQAKDRLVFATTRLNEARQSVDLGEPERAAGQLRAAEGAIAQAAVLVAAVERLGEELAAADRLVPAALTGAEAEIAGARERVAAGVAEVPVGELRARIRHADTVLGTVREELTARRPYDPLDLLRRIARAVLPLADGRAGVVEAAAVLVARHTTAAADDFVATHLGGVGAEARTRLAEAVRLLAPGPERDPRAADELARQARHLAEQDVRVQGSPYAEAAGPVTGFGGPRTRDRRAPA